MSSFYSSYTFADLNTQCLVGIPQFSGELVKGDISELPLYIEADNAVINQTNSATYSGNVAIKQGSRKIGAEHIQVARENDKFHSVIILGDFSYQDHLIQATGNNAVVHLQQKYAELNSADYQLVGRQGRGKADFATADNDKRVMKNATFTSCLPSDNSWAIDANEMIQHIKEEYAELWHARFKVMGIPIFYSPYLQFPIGNRRRSGILIPNVGYSSRDGYFYSQALYWNIASNVDATLTPTYYSRRGWQLSPELRYLTSLGEGKVAAEYIRNDRLLKDARYKNRYLLFWQHNSNFLNNWRFSINYTSVSDRYYFSNFNSNYGSSTDGYATQLLKLGYYKPNYNISILLKRFQTFDKSGSKPYQVPAQINYHYYKNNVLNYADFALFSQLSYFSTLNKTMPKAVRFHIEPVLNLPLSNRFGSLNLETKLYATQYWQKKGSSQKAESVKARVTRVLPQIKLDLKTTLESTKSMIQGYTQTLEPRIQYLYRPYENQANIGSRGGRSLGLGYDSALLQQTYFSLFNDRRYSGLDRIASANQITFGGTTRYFKNETGEEVFNLSLGQIYYISPSRIDDSSRNSKANRSSSWSLESHWKPHSNWNWYGSYQYDTRLNKTALANISLQFKPKKDNFFQINYHYASKNYIDQNLITNLYGQDIKQLGGVLGWEVTDNISLAASHYQDLALKKPVETRLSITYNNCCWSANVYTARRLISTPAGKPDGPRNVYYDNNIGLNFELRFGSSHNSSIPKMLKRGLIPYIDIF